MPVLLFFNIQKKKDEPLKAYYSLLNLASKFKRMTLPFSLARSRPTAKAQQQNIWRALTTDTAPASISQSGL